MARPFCSAWGLIFLSALVATVVAVFLQVQQTPLWTSAGTSETETFCYEGVRTLSDEADAADANCFTVSEGTFTRVFASSPGQRAEHEFRQGYVIPGLWDGHGHVIEYGEFLHSVDLFGSDSVQEVRRRIGAYLDTHPAAGSRDDWIRGVGWDQMALGTMPTAEMLSSDPRLASLYILLDRVDVHCVWASQAVLDLLSIPDDDIPGGEIVRDPGLGVFCDNAMDLANVVRPVPTAAQRRAFLTTAAAALHAVGLVGVHDAGAVPDEVEMYEALVRQQSQQEPPWTLRVYAMLECPTRNTFCAEHAHPRAVGSQLWVRGVKLFGDGALGSWGSAMLEPYTDRPDWRGGLLLNESALAAVAARWAAAGFQVNVHAIGDRANRAALDALEGALRRVCPSAQDDEQQLAACQAEHWRFRLEHAQIVHPADQQRVRALGILASVQPTHATSDMRYAEARLGPERTARSAYRMRSFWDSGVVLGSDFPVEPPNPFQGMYAAVARKSPHTGRGADGGDEGWHMEEALSLDQALEGFTKGPARGAFLEGRAGVIQDGAFADWVVLDQPLEAVAIDDLRKIKVRETWVGGRRVYAAPS